VLKILKLFGKERCVRSAPTAGQRQIHFSLSQEEVLRRHTFSASGNEPCAQDAEVPRSKSCSSAPAAKKLETPDLSKLQVKSSLVVLGEDLETGLVVIGRSAALQRKQPESDCEATEQETETKLLLGRDDSDEGEPKVCSPPPPPSFRN